MMQVANMTGYQFRLCCRWCGGAVAHVADGVAHGFDTRAIARCVECGTEWTVIVQLADPKQGRAKVTAAKSAAMAHARDMKLGVVV